jgi:formylglycine-generating enzyme required for sulfatase activity
MIEVNWPFLSLEARIQAGNALGYLGDPRIDQTVRIPEGDYVLGEESAKRVVHIATFQIDKFPITNAQYDAFCRTTNHPPPVHWIEGHPPTSKLNHPVVHVGFEDAKEYARWAGKRLVTEDEWEAAARGPHGNNYPWGMEFDAEACNLWDSGIGDTTPIGSFPKGLSPSGVSDMMGNVWEWTLEQNSQNTGILRGGSWNSLSSNVGCTTRYASPPPHLCALVGFRCAQ